jgi:hypothetical protein
MCECHPAPPALGTDARLLRAAGSFASAQDDIRKPAKDDRPKPEVNAFAGVLLTPG